MTEKKAVFNTFHSSSSRYLQKEEPKEIVGFDNRFEVNIVDEYYYDVVGNLPFIMAQAFLSPNIHLLMGKFTRTNLVISKDCLLSKTGYLARNFGLPFRDLGFSELKESVNECLETDFVFLESQDIKSSLSSFEDVVVDVGLGYMEEFREESLFPADCASLGSKEDLFGLIGEVEPSLVLFSNVRSPEGISGFLDEIEDMGYSIEMGQVFESEKAMDAMSLYGNFVDFHLDEIREDEEYNPKYRAEDLKSWIIDRSPFKEFIG